MSIDKNLPRQTSFQVKFDGVDITESLKPYLISLDYTDNQEDECDDLQIKLHDRDRIWTTEWLNDIIDAAASLKSASKDTTSAGSGATNKERQDARDRNKVTALKISAKIIRHNWTEPGKDDVLPCGLFELDSVAVGGPPATITIKATSLSYNRPIRQTKRSQAWERYHLSGIAQEMASKSGMSCQYLSSTNPYYNREEQDKTSDIEFLSGLCHKAGLSLKCTNNTLVIFNQKDEERKAAVRTFKHGDGSYGKYKLNAGTAGTNYQYCRVHYVTKSGTLIEGFAYAEDYQDPEAVTESSGSSGKTTAEKQAEIKEKNRLLDIHAAVSSIAEAEALAQKYLRLNNKYARTCQFDIDGDPIMVAGVNIRLKNWGGFDGKYSITSVKHSVGTSGYQCTVSGRKIFQEPKGLSNPPEEQEPASTTTIQKGDKVKVVQGARTYYGETTLQDWCYNYVFDVIQVGGDGLPADRIVIGIGSAVTAAMKEKDLYKV